MYILWAYLCNLRYDVFYKCVLNVIGKGNSIDMGSALFVDREAHSFPSKPTAIMFYLRDTLTYETSFVAQNET